MKTALLAGLLCALGALAGPVLAASEPAAPKPVEHTVHLTDADLQAIQWMVTTYGGEHCGVSDQAAVYCQGAIAGRDLLIKLQAQLASEAATAKPAAK